MVRNDRARRFKARLQTGLQGGRTLQSPRPVLIIAWTAEACAYGDRMLGLGAGHIMLGLNPLINRLMLRRSCTHRHPLRPLARIYHRECDTRAITVSRHCIGTT